MKDKLNKVKLFHEKLGGIRISCFEIFGEKIIFFDNFWL